MLAMQYSIPLPADYDMAIIRQRIATRGSSTDGFPGLAFKAYLHADKTGPETDNLYAPFYLWDSSEGMNAFLGGPGFVALTQSFGWPAVKIWSIWRSHVSAGVSTATRATRETAPIPPHSDLAALWRAESEHLDDVVSQHGAVAVVVGYEPQTWSLVRFSLWPGEPQDAAADALHYEVGHLSLPKPT